ncbi:MAG: YidC/Oxa1 family membrane protein insertase [Actinomycetota bacterium]
MEAFNALLRGLGSALAFFYDMIPNYGVAIILLTIAVRLALLPLTLKQTRSMQAMQKLQPEMKRLQAKHKGDRQKLNEETMKLYKEHQVNPLGGCLPLVLQLPVFIALYQVLSGCGKWANRKAHRCAPGFVGVKFLPADSALSTAIMGGSAGFLGMDLGLTPSLAFRSEGVAGFIPYGVLILLMAVTTWYQQKQLQATQVGTQAAQMQLIGKITPVLLPVFSINLPVGVSLYWVVSNLWTIGQQYFLLQRKAPAPIPAVPGSSGDGQAPSKPKPKPAPAPGKGRPTPKRVKPTTGKASGSRSNGKADGRAPSKGGSGGKDAPTRKKRNR